MERQYFKEYEATEFSNESMPLNESESDNNIQVDEQREIYSNYHGMNSINGSINYSLFTQPFLNQWDYPMLINLNSLPSMLSENRKMLVSATKASHECEIDDAIGLLQRIHKNLIFLANAADLQSNSRFILRQERELISQKDLSFFDSKYGYNDEDKKKESNEKKDKQIKVAWTSEEHNKFLEGLKMFGEK